MINQMLKSYKDWSDSKKVINKNYPSPSIFKQRQTTFLYTCTSKTRSTLSALYVSVNLYTT